MSVMTVRNANKSEYHAEGSTSEIRDYLSAIGRYPLLSHEEEVDLARRYAGGDMDAGRRLILANLRFVVSIARHYHTPGMEMLDVIQEGTIGLMRAVERFDVNKGYRLCTYATWWIRQAISRAIDEAHLIHVPAHVAEDARKLRHIREVCESEPSAEEVARLAGWDVQRARRVLSLVEQPVSLDTPIDGDDEHWTLGHTLEDTTHPEVSHGLEHDMLRAQITEALGVLTPRERKVIELRYGLHDGPSHTLDELAKLFKLTKERIRQIEVKALRKLQWPMWRQLAGMREV